MVMNDDFRYVAERAQAELWTEQHKRRLAEQQRDAAYALLLLLLAMSPRDDVTEYADGQAWRA